MKRHLGGKRPLGRKLQRTCFIVNKVSTNRRRISLRQNGLMCKDDCISPAPTICKNERTEILRRSVDRGNLLSLRERRVRGIEYHRFGGPD